MGTAKTYLAKILHTTESTATTGRKVTMVVSTGARRRGQGEEGRKILFC
jgi:hypothetical protein